MENLLYNPTTVSLDADRIDVLEKRGAKPPMRGYFFAYHSAPSMGCCVVGPKCPLVTLTSTSTLRNTPPPIDVGPTIQSQEDTPMPECIQRAAALALAIPIRRNRAGGASC